MYTYAKLRNRIVAIFLSCVIFVIALFLPSARVLATSLTNEGRTYYVYDASTGAYLSSYTLSALPTNTASTSSDISLTSVYGDEDSRVLDYTKNGVVKLVSSSGAVGTGFVVDEHTIATAAHCVVTSSTTSNCKNTVKEIYCFNGSSTVDMTASLNEIHVPAEYFTAGNGGTTEYDYALITVEEDLSDYMCFALGTMLDSYSGTVSISGFPGTIKQSDGTYITANDLEKHNQYLGTGTVLSSETGRIAYTVDTTGGNSGSPVYVTSTYKSNVYYTVIAIHTTGSYSGNSGTRITPTLLQFYYNNDNL